jgi:hypothetical protein
MSKRVFFFGALLLVIAALLTHVIARGFLEDYLHRKAARINEASTQHAPYVADPLASRAVHTYDVLTSIGLALTGLSVISMVIALVRRESGWYLILGMLQMFAIMAAMLL